MTKPAVRSFTALLLAVLLMVPQGLLAANHREAPITAIDRLADITDFYAFVSYDNPDKVTFILDVDPLLEPSNGPNYFPFDPNITYAIRVDNNHDGIEDIVFEFRFQTEYRLPGVFTAHVGAGDGIPAGPSSPPPVAPGSPLIPPAVTALDGCEPGNCSTGLGLRQTYTVTMVRNNLRTVLNGGQKLIAVPSNVGPRTMPNWADLYQEGIYTLGNGIKVWAGTADDPFWIDLGAFFDSANFRASGFILPGVLTDAQEADDRNNFAADDVSGFNVNAIAIEVPITMLTSDGQKHPASDPRATIGSWGTTSRPQVTVLQKPLKGRVRSTVTSTSLRQVQRMGNALFNELIIGTGSKDRFSMDQPKNDAQFAAFALDPLLARVINAVYPAAFGVDVPIPAPPRADLLPLVQYSNHGALVAAVGGFANPNLPAGPVADILRLNTGVPPTPQNQIKRMGLLAGDAAGYPNGRRLEDDVTDISARAVAGILVFGLNTFPYNRIGDGVNANDTSYQPSFPYLGYAWDGRNSRHVDPGEDGCNGGACTVN
ncbi:MAG TPA: DUF4331 domain-containing protein [Terriglobales bacterium]|nr:DUF4331 domain-containing protein [Terriglobales bacterium]